MFVKELTVLQIREIYRNHMVNDFAVAELKPMDIVFRLIEQGIYICYGLFKENDEIMAYAMFCGQRDSDRLLLDYFAVISGNRGGGIGGEFLELLKNQFADKALLILEVENPAYAKDGKQMTEMERRILFYQRHGVILTDITCRLFGVELSIMYLPLLSQQTEEQVYAALDQIYHLMFCRHMYDKYVLLRK